MKSLKMSGIKDNVAVLPASRRLSHGSVHVLRLTYASQLAVFHARDRAPPWIGLDSSAHRRVVVGCKMLAKAGFQVAILRLADPTDGYDFDTIIVGGDEGIVITRADGA
jgi:hypothetical protein